MKQNTDDITSMYIEAGILRKVSMGDIIGEFMYNLENYAKLYSEDQSSTYIDKHKKIIDLETTDILGLIMDNDDNNDIDVLLDYIMIRLNEIENKKR